MSGGQCESSIRDAPGQVKVLVGRFALVAKMRQTKICTQVLWIVDRLGRLTAEERSSLMRRSEAIARKRHSHVLGVRHVLEAAARILPAGVPE